MKDFEEWLIILGERSVDYSYTSEMLYKNIDYLKKCWSEGLSCYKTLEFFSLHLYPEN